MIGVLALQGGYAAHLEMMRSLTSECILVRNASELEQCQGLIIPGGESSTMTRLIEREGLFEPLVEFSNRGAVFGTCAGMILMSKQHHDSRVAAFGLIDIEVCRNGYGRQIDSFTDALCVHCSKLGESVSGTFIRAPRIVALGAEVEVLVSHKGEPVMVRQGSHIAASFHPELGSDPSIHQYFLKEIVGTLPNCCLPS